VLALTAYFFLFLGALPSFHGSSDSDATTTTTTTTTYPPCAGPQTLITPTGTFSSGTPYNNNAACTWLLLPSDASSAQQLVLAFSRFQTESNFDVMRVYDGDSVGAPLLLEHSGRTVPSPVTGSGPVLFVQFTSDASVAANGLVRTARWQSSVCRSCGAAHGGQRRAEQRRQ
jgi:CUB domain